MMSYDDLAPAHSALRTKLLDQEELTYASRYNAYLGLHHDEHQFKREVKLYEQQPK